MVRGASLRVLQRAAQGSEALQATAACQQCRVFGTVPEYWGKDSPYHPGTTFLGTPKNHEELAAKRPVSPHVFEMDEPSKPHYKMPINAVSSIMTRVTGCMLSGTVIGAGALALNGDLLPVVDWVRDSFLVYPARALVTFPLVYHYGGGIRHLLWDTAKYKRQSEKGDVLDPDFVDKSSYALLGGSAAATLALAVTSF